MSRVNLVKFRYTLIVLSLSVVPVAWGQSGQTSAVPRLIRFAGVACDLSSKPLTGIVGVTFALYAEQTGGAPLWMETQNVQADANGRYSVLLGSTKPDGLPGEIFASEQARWIGAQIEQQAEQPRMLLVSAPYALKAADAETIGGLPPSAFLLANAPSANNPQPITGNAASVPPFPGSAAGVQNAAPPPAETTNRIAKFINTTGGLGNSLLFDNGTNLGLGTTTPGATLDVKGSINAQTGLRSEADLRVLQVPLSSLSSWIFAQNPDIALGTFDNQVSVKNLGTDVLSKRNGLSVLDETSAPGGSGVSYNGLQSVMAVTLNRNTSPNTKHTAAGEFYAMADGSIVQLNQLKAVKGSIVVTAGTSVNGATTFLAYLPVIAGHVNQYAAFQVDAPAGGGSVYDFIGVNALLNTSNLTAGITNSFGGEFVGSGGTTAAILLEDDEGPDAGAIKWGIPPNGSGAAATIHSGIYKYGGNPNGVVTANLGSQYYDATSGLAYIKNSGAGTNTGWLQEAMTIKATSAAFATATTAGTCVQNTTAVTGATATMAVSVSPQSTPGIGAQWSAFVSSAGNVTINECAVATSAGGTIAFNIDVFAN